MANICSNEFYAESKDKGNIEYIYNYFDNIYQGNVIDLSQEEGSVESQFDSKWSFPEEEMKELFNGLPNKDEIYMRCLSVEFGCRYVEYHECEGKEGWYLS